VLDTKDVFRSTIVEFFIDQHRRGVTPNPCLECNRHIRFEWLQQHALALDAEYLATGHYARIAQDESGRFQLKKGIYDAKDQATSSASWARSSSATRSFRSASTQAGGARIGRALRPATASKHDSQDLCFLATAITGAS